MTTASGVARLLAKIEGGEARCGVVGLGYVGLPLALAFAQAGYRVLGFDVSESVVAGVNAGRSHLRDIDDAEVGDAITRKRLEATPDSSRLSACDAVAICVPTPLSKTREPDLGYVVAAAEAVAQNLRPGQLVILESTSYPGTTRDLLLPILEEGGLSVGEDFLLCFSPERTDPGNPAWGVKNTPKVIGGITPRCLHAGLELYGRALDQLVPVSSPEAAELSKLLENTFRAVNIALVNEMAQVADRLDVDIWEVIDAADTKPFGFTRFTPGPGIGGHCIPLDPHYLAWRMRALDYQTRMVELAADVNRDMPRYVLDRIQDALNRHGRALKGSRVLVLGVAYKRDVADIRESPAIDLIRLLEGKGSETRYHDPHVPALPAEAGSLRSVALSETELRSADCVVIATDHSVIDYVRVVRLARLVLDTRNATRDVPGRSAKVVGLSGSVVSS
jgi:UDP-N-acetyl-D-glucosamine dehydrogenase